jgi:hypothetical protein
LAFFAAKLDTGKIMRQTVPLWTAVVRRMWDNAFLVSI